MRKNKIYPENYKYYTSKKQSDKVIKNESKKIIRSMYFFYIFVIVLGIII